MRNLKFLLSIGMAFGLTMMLHATEQIPIDKDANLKFSVEALHLKMPFVTISADARELSLAIQTLDDHTFFNVPVIYNKRNSAGFKPYDYNPDLKRELFEKLHASARLKM